MPPEHRASQSIASLVPLRREIDDIDRRILALLSQRAVVATRVAALKAVLSLPTHDPSRERALVARLSAENRGPLDETAIANVFGAILAASRALMESVRARGAVTPGGTETPCDSRPRASTPSP
mgnify:CR=1 FL=1